MRFSVFLCVLALSSVCLVPARAYWYADSVVDSFNLGFPPAHNPQAALGSPSTLVYEPGFPPFVPPGTFRTSLVYPAWGTDPQGNHNVVTLRERGRLTVAFAQPIEDHPDNWYGKDFIVFGNALFTADRLVQGDMDMTQVRIKNGTEGTWEPLRVSVSQDGTTWYSFTGGPFADDYAPTQGFAWDWISGSWGPALDYTKPVPSHLERRHFAGLTVASAIDLYQDSGGGTPYDIGQLPLPVDPQTGRKWIRYVRLTADILDEDGFAFEGEVDAVSRVAPARPPVLLGQAKGMQDGTRVEIGEAVVAAGTFQTGAFAWVQSPDRSAGMRVEGRLLQQGQRVRVFGVLDTLGGEKVIRATALEVLGEGSARPLHIRLDTLLQAPPLGNRGPSLAGLLVRASGRITAVSPQTGTFTLSDASGSSISIRAPRGNGGQGVHPEFIWPVQNTFSTVTGIATAEGGQPAILLRTPADLHNP